MRNPKAHYDGDDLRPIPTVRRERLVDGRNSLFAFPFLAASIGARGRKLYAALRHKKPAVTGQVMREIDGARYFFWAALMD